MQLALVRWYVWIIYKFSFHFVIRLLDLMVVKLIKIGKCCRIELHKTQVRPTRNYLWPIGIGNLIKMCGMFFLAMLVFGHYIFIVTAGWDIVLAFTHHPLSGLNSAVFFHIFDSTSYVSKRLSHRANFIHIWV